MKKRAKKLVLAKETLRSLELELERIVGGMSEVGCAYTNEATCGCASADCTATSPSNRVVCR